MRYKILTIGRVLSQSISEIKKEFPVDLIVHTKAMHQRFIEINSLFTRELLSKGILLHEKITNDCLSTETPH